MKTLNIGDQVAYSAAFCRSIGALTGDIPFMRGKVIEKQTIGKRELIRVQWADRDEPMLVLRSNLAPVGPNAEFCSV